MADYELVRIEESGVRGYVYRAPDMPGNPRLYLALEFSNSWTIERQSITPAGMITIESAKAEVADADAADAWARRDWRALRNEIAWITYMANNPPPQ